MLCKFSVFNTEICKVEQVKADCILRHLLLANLLHTARKQTTFCGSNPVQPKSNSSDSFEAVANIDTGDNNTELGYTQQSPYPAQPFVWHRVALTLDRVFTKTKKPLKHAHATVITSSNLVQLYVSCSPGHRLQVWTAHIGYSTKMCTEKAAKNAYKKQEAVEKQILAVLANCCDMGHST